jgi:phosphoserine phosphatase
MAVKIIFFDCDGTLTDVKSSWQYLHERLNLWNSNADEYQRLFAAGLIDYYEFCKRDAVAWKGLTMAEIRSIIGEINYHDGVRETLRKIHEKGIVTVILSTGLTVLIDRVRQELEITYAVANELEAQNGMITGDVAINITHGHKGVWVRKILGEYGFAKNEAAAVGDGEGDREMFEEVGCAIGFHPTESILPLVHYVLDKASFPSIVDIVRQHS